MLLPRRTPSWHTVLGAGPVFSYYEFKQPARDRLTDEKWREMLNSGKAPRPPKWTSSFMVGKQGSGAEAGGHGTMRAFRGARRYGKIGGNVPLNAR